MFGKFKNSVFASFVAFCIILLILVAFLNLKTQRDSSALLGESVNSQLIAICLSAREVIDADELMKINDLAATQNNPVYTDTLDKLRHLAIAVGAKYIYVLRYLDGKYVFIYDTDTENATAFTDYGLSPVHVDAFRGKESAAIMNVQDAFGNFSTGAVPIWRDGKVVGIVSADIEDTFIARNSRTGRLNTLLLIGVAGVTMIAMTLIMRHLLRRLKEMQDRLTQLAHYDAVTGLPNRQYLFDFLDDLVGKEERIPFVLFFIDLDNFKKVNDVAGHDAGDALLRRIGAYLERPLGGQRNTRVFRLGAGKLNVAARVGGDEFIIVVPYVDSGEGAADIAGDLLGRFRKDAIDEHVLKFNVGMSIGGALYPSQSEDLNVLIKYADIAMYHAKKMGKNRFFIYNDEMPDKAEK